MFLICSENYKRVKVNANGYTDNGERYSISALKRDGEPVKKHFGGFIDNKHLLGVRLVKLVNIAGVFNGKELVEIPKGHWVLGIYHKNTFLVLQEYDQPLHHPIDYEKYSKKYKNNVVTLRP
ncbi:hypothetical protein L1D28_05645 [Vibrio chagasii]|uniref:hypothetical protein n=1 Tax=Vibrio chagasii TaxID=170679 RepID=UPI001EFE4630|nr:hypothetical protein [Vibrio chagasii]MCG9561126.1 hypothetical protein [Vibrio chagasii]